MSEVSAAEAESAPAFEVSVAAFEAGPASAVWAADTAAGLGIEADPDIAAGPDTAAEAVREEPAADIEAVDLAERPVPEAVTAGA